MRLQYWLQAHAIPTFEANIRMYVTNYVMLHSYNYFSEQLSGNIANKIRDLMCQQFSGQTITQFFGVL